MKGFKSFARETRIPFDRHVNVVVGPNGSGKSCSYDTLVKLSNGGEIEIGKLVEEQLKKSKENEIKNLDDGVYVNGNEGIEIISLNKDNGKAEKKKVSKFIKRDGEVIYKIKTRSGKEIKATGCHPVMTFKDEEIKSVLIRDLNKGGLIATPRLVDIKSDVEFDSDLARLIGYLIGDGYLAKDRIEFVNNDIEIINDFKELVRRFFGIHGKELRERHEKGVVRLYFRDKKVVKEIRDYFIKDSGESITSGVKKIPDFLLRAGNDCISSVLAGLYDTDGSIRKDIMVIEFCSKNKELVNQMQGLLLRFGIQSKIKKRMCCASNTENKIKREYYYLYIYGVNNLKKFYNNVSLKIGYKRGILEEHLSKNIIPNPNTDLLPRELNIYIRELVRLLGVKVKPLRKDYPLLSAYVENRCLPTRMRIKRIMSIFNEKLLGLNSLFENLREDKISLISCMDGLNISGQQASIQLGLQKGIIRNHWAMDVTPKPENLQRFYNLIKETFEMRFVRVKELMSLFNMMINSDIYWDEVISVEKLGKEEYVYDLTIEGNHNFIANNIFVHNSNITDALCFVLGRLSIKSIRAAKASHLIFSGNKHFKGGNIAYVEIVFDNQDKTFALETEEIAIRRIVKKNGQGVYKINGETKTRQEVLELLSQAGIDPHGFNIVLQGEIEKFVKMPTEERRKVIEEVAGISVYEMRKEKSLRELDKTNERLKQINAILRERTNYLRNLENEREQAMRYKKLQETVKRCKASIINRNIVEREKGQKEISGKIEIVNKEIEKKEKEVEEVQGQIKDTNERIDHIGKTIQEGSGLEQDSLLNEISSFRQEIAGLTARKESYENNLIELDRRKERLGEDIKTAEKEIKEMIQEKGKDKKKDLEEKKNKLEDLDDVKRKYYLLKSDLSSMNNQIEDKKRQIQRLKNESNFILNQIEGLEGEIKIKGDLNEHKKELVKLRDLVERGGTKINSLEKDLLENEKICAIQNSTIKENEIIKSDVSKIDTCPLCKTKITEEHIKHVVEKAEKDIMQSKATLEKAEDEITNAKENIQKLKEDIIKRTEEVNLREICIVKLQGINDKKSQLKRDHEQTKILDNELTSLEEKKKSLEKRVASIKISEEHYETLKLEVNELQRSEERNLGSEITMKQRELERAKLAIKQNIRDKNDIDTELEEIEESLEEKEEIVEEKERQAEELKEKYQKMFERKNFLQDNVRAFESSLLGIQNEKRNLESNINNLRIEKAQINARIESLREEVGEFSGVEFLNLPLDKLKEKLENSERVLDRIGNVNLRALEVYEGIKEGYDKIREKVERLEEEREEILKIIEQIDRKKKKTFLNTLKEVNESFSRNFSQLSTKGIVSLEPQDKKEIFNAGLSIIVKVGAGKYFDVTSLSGGEQTLVALSLIFAIQDFRPYSFYIFDEIDAALDRRNSEKLAYLLKKHMKAGQYLMITHNDSIISESSNVLYGVSMQDGISKVLSLEI